MLKHPHQGLELGKQQTADQMPFAPDCETSNMAKLSCRRVFARRIARSQGLCVGSTAVGFANIAAPPFLRAREEKHAERLVVQAQFCDARFGATGNMGLVSTHL
jgi:hypothetical protein